MRFSFLLVVLCLLASTHALRGSVNSTESKCNAACSTTCKNKQLNCTECCKSKPLAECVCQAQQTPQPAAPSKLLEQIDDEEELQKQESQEKARCKQACVHNCATNAMECEACCGSASSPQDFRKCRSTCEVKEGGNKGGRFNKEREECRQNCSEDCEGDAQFKTGCLRCCETKSHPRFFHKCNDLCWS